MIHHHPPNQPTSRFSYEPLSITIPHLSPVPDCDASLVRPDHSPMQITTGVTVGTTPPSPICPSGLRINPMVTSRDRYLFVINDDGKEDRETQRSRGYRWNSMIPGYEPFDLMGASGAASYYTTRILEGRQDILLPGFPLFGKTRNPLLPVVRWCCFYDAYKVISLGQLEQGVTASVTIPQFFFNYVQLVCMQFILIIRGGFAQQIHTPDAKGNPPLLYKEGNPPYLFHYFQSFDFVEPAPEKKPKKKTPEEAAASRIEWKKLVEGLHQPGEDTLMEILVDMALSLPMYQFVYIVARYIVDKLKVHEMEPIRQFAERIQNSVFDNYFSEKANQCHLQWIDTLNFKSVFVEQLKNECNAMIGSMLVLDVKDLVKDDYPKSYKHNDSYAKQRILRTNRDYSNLARYARCIPSFYTHLYFRPDQPVFVVPETMIASLVDEMGFALTYRLECLRKEHRDDARKQEQRILGVRSSLANTEDNEEKGELKREEAGMEREQEETQSRYRQLARAELDRSLFVLNAEDGNDLPRSKEKAEAVKWVYTHLAPYMTAGYSKSVLQQIRMQTKRGSVWKTAAGASSEANALVKSYGVFQHALVGLNIARARYCCVYHNHKLYATMPSTDNPVSLLNPISMTRMAWTALYYRCPASKELLLPDLPGLRRKTAATTGWYAINDQYEICIQDPVQFPWYYGVVPAVLDIVSKGLQVISHGRSDYLYHLYQTLLWSVGGGASLEVVIQRIVMICRGLRIQLLHDDDENKSDWMGLSRADIAQHHPHLIPYVLLRRQYPLFVQHYETELFRRVTASNLHEKAETWDGYSEVESDVKGLGDEDISYLRVVWMFRFPSDHHITYGTTSLVDRKARQLLLQVNLATSSVYHTLVRRTREALSERELQEEVKRMKVKGGGEEDTTTLTAFWMILNAAAGENKEAMNVIEQVFRNDPMVVVDTPQHVLCENELTDALLGYMKTYSQLPMSFVEECRVNIVNRRMGSASFDSSSMILSGIKRAMSLIPEKEKVDRIQLEWRSMMPKSDFINAVVKMKVVYKSK